MDYKLLIIGMGLSFLRARLQAKLTPAQYEIAAQLIARLEQLLYAKLAPKEVKALRSVMTVEPKTKARRK